MSAPIPEPTFAVWFKANLSECAEEIAGHGADAGWPLISYTSDCVALFERYGGELWEMLVEDAEEQGLANAAALLASFGRADMLSSLDGMKALVVWYGCERAARSEEWGDAGEAEEDKLA